MNKGRPRNFGALDHLSLTPPLKVPDVDFGKTGGTFGVVKKSPPTAIAKKRRKRLKKLLEENPAIAAEIDAE
jgi:hypothetical protein